MLETVRWFTGEMLETIRWFVASSDSFEVRGMYSCCFLFCFSILVNLKILEDWEQVIYLTGTHRKRLWSCLGGDSRRKEDQHRGVFNRLSPRSHGLNSPGTFWGQMPLRIAAWGCRAGLCLLWLPAHEVGRFWFLPLLAYPFELSISMASRKASGLKAERYTCPVLRWRLTGASQSKSELTLELFQLRLKLETRDMWWPHTCSENVYIEKLHLPSILLCSWKPVLLFLLFSH